MDTRRVLARIEKSMAQAVLAAKQNSEHAALVRPQLKASKRLWNMTCKRAIEKLDAHLDKAPERIQQQLALLRETLESAQASESRLRELQTALIAQTERLDSISTDVRDVARIARQQLDAGTEPQPSQDAEEELAPRWRPGVTDQHMPRNASLFVSPLLAAIDV